jgi:hypothetical protein
VLEFVEVEAVAWVVDLVLPLEVVEVSGDDGTLVTGGVGAGEP